MGFGADSAAVAAPRAGGGSGPCKPALTNIRSVFSMSALMSHRLVKDQLYEHLAHIGKALSSPKRLELLEMLAQGEKTVEALASELSIDVKLSSAHLKSLKAARLVQSRRDGKY